MSNQQHAINLTTGTINNNNANEVLLNATGLGHNTSSYDSNRHLLLKHELYQTKRQLADAQNSYQFVKREKLRVEHEKNLIEIQLRQVEEAEAKRAQEEEAREMQVAHVNQLYQEEREQVRVFKEAMMQQEARYKDKLV